MNSKLNNIKLTEKDKKIISMNLSICTDSHGKSCSLAFLAVHNKELN